MPMGLFTQSTMVLFERAPRLDAVRDALGKARHEVVRETEKTGDGWLGGFPGLLIAHRPEVNGYVAVDVVDRRWPDGMGDPAGEADLFGCWTMGGFGPLVFPGNLARAAQQCVTCAVAAQRAADGHGAFVRMRVSYVLGAGGDAPVLPADHDPRGELDRLTAAAGALLALPGALALFNPNGEVLLDAPSVRESLSWAEKGGIPPLDVWTHVRMFKVPGEHGSPEWLLMDTVGLGQLMLDDLEVWVPPRGPDANAVAGFLRNVSLYLLTRGPLIEDRDTVDGPGGTWMCRHEENSVTAPPRPTLRWTLRGAPTPPPLAV
jgi:hypothetical protein